MFKFSCRIAENLFAKAKGEAKFKTNCEKLMGSEYQDKNFKFICGPTESKKDNRIFTITLLQRTRFAVRAMKFVVELITF